MSVKHHPDCWLAAHARMENDDPMPPCEGQLIRAHLIKQQTIERYGGETGDPRSYVLACGGLTGVGGHHGLLDFSRRLRIPRDEIPDDTEVFAHEMGIDWWLDRTYGPRGTPVAALRPADGQTTPGGLPAAEPGPVGPQTAAGAVPPDKLGLHRKLRRGGRV